MIAPTRNDLPTRPGRSSRAARIVVALWIGLAVIVWNDVFDQVIINAGRHYLFGAFASAATGGPFLLMADAMRPAIARAFWMATAVALPVLVVGLAAVRFASRLPRNETGVSTDAGSLS